MRSWDQSVSQSFSLSVKSNPNIFFPFWSSLAGGSGPGQDGERRCDPGRETPRQERLHEEVSGGPQPGRRGLDHCQGGQHHQAQGWFDICIRNVHSTCV